MKAEKSGKKQVPFTFLHFSFVCILEPSCPFGLFKVDMEVSSCPLRSRPEVNAPAQVGNEPHMPKANRGLSVRHNFCK